MILRWMILLLVNVFFHKYDPKRWEGTNPLQSSTFFFFVRPNVFRKIRKSTIKFHIIFPVFKRALHLIKEAGKKFRRYIRKHEIQPRLSSFVKKVARRLDELIIGVKCAIYISVHGSLEQEISAYPIRNIPAILLFFPYKK